MYISHSDQKIKEPEQGSEKWHELRKQYIWTGSRPSGVWWSCNSQDDREKLLAQWLTGSSDMDELGLKRCKWGSDNEIVCARELCSTFPHSIFLECPSIKVNDWMAISPDGQFIMRNDEEEILWSANVEIKCTGKYKPNGEMNTDEEMKKKLSKSKHPKAYYLTQVHMEMIAQKIKHTIYVEWTPLLMRIWRIDFDNEYWEVALDMMLAFKDPLVEWDVLEHKLNTWKRYSRRLAYSIPVWQDISK